MSNIPIYRAKKIDSDEYVEGMLTTDLAKEVYGTPLFFIETITRGSYIELITTEVDPSTLAIKMPERDFFMSLDAKAGKGGDKISEDEVLVWNGEMMNCSVLSLYPDGSINDYEISLDNCDYDEMEVIGIQS